MSAPRNEGVVELIDDLVRRAIAAGASDIHFEPDAERLRVRFRVDALLRDVEELPAALGPNVVARLKVMAGLLTYRTDVPQEGTVSLPTGSRGSHGDAPGSGRAPARPADQEVGPSARTADRELGPSARTADRELGPSARTADREVGRYDIRVATFPTIHGERAVLRLLGQAAGLRGLDDLGHDPALVTRLRRLVALPQGLLIVCGPAGSGKTTTLHALLKGILEARPGLSILSIEDPVEIRQSGITQVEIEPARGLTYAVALRSLLRQDPQVLMVGEVRDAETAHLVVEAALTGHLLLTTLHSGSPAEALVRLREMGVPAYQLTSTVQAVLAQRLVRTICPACRQSKTLGEGSVHGAGQPVRDVCPRCLGAGYAGRMAIGQLVEMSPALRTALLAAADVAALATVCPGSLRADAQRLVAAGVTTPDELARVLGEP